MKLVCCCLICCTFCVSNFFAAAVGLTELAGLVCATDGATLADAAAAGVVLAAAAGVVLAVVAGGVVAAAAAAAVAVALGAAVMAGVVLAVAGVVLGEVLALVAGDFLSFRFWVDFSFLSAGVVLAAGASVEVFVSVVSAFGVCVLGFTSAGPFFSVFVAAGDSVAVDSFSFRAGASVFGASVGASVFGPSVFGGRVALGLISAGAFFSGACFLAGDSSGVDCWAITAPASASETTISKLVIFFMVALFWS